MNKCIAIIPARGGSKRIPRKNIKNFLGKPIIFYAIESALKSELFDEVLVSTDDEEIATIAKKYGAKVPFFRSAKNADDHATTFSVLEEVLTTYNSVTSAACIYPTAPFVTPEKLKQAQNLLRKNNFDTVFTAMKYGHHIERALQIDETTGKIKMIDARNMNTRSQDLKDTYHDAGQFYFFNTAPILKAKSLWTNNTGALIVDELEAQDIDTLTDWKLAELKFKLSNEIS
ncbi:MAG: pseudaminic acid cytidylyltransferase [Flavobacteriaceae bacterium]